MALWPEPNTTTLVPEVSRTSSQITQVQVTSGSVAHAKGAWTTIKTTTEDSKVLHVYISETSVSGAASDTLVDIAIGAVGSETIFASNLMAGYKDPISTGIKPIILPLTLPVGTRISARAQSVVASKVVRIGIDAFAGSSWAPPPSLAAITPYGVSTATSKGTVLTAGSPSHTKGSWVDLVTSTTRRHTGLLLLGGPNSRIVTSAENWIIDVGVWNGSAYDIIWPDISLRYTNTESLHFVTDNIIPVRLSLPAGSRLGARVQSSVASITGDVALYGLG